MAKKLNKYAARCKEIAIACGRIAEGSSSRPLLYDISRDWRASLDATNFKSDHHGGWTEKEVGAAEIIFSAMAYLDSLECKDIEQLIVDIMERHARQNE